MDIETGKKFIREGNYLEAKRIFQNLLNKKESPIVTNYFLGIIYFELQSYKKSKFHYNKSLELNPNSKEILINLAYLEQTYGKFENAEAIYEKLLKLYPYYVETYYRMYLLNSNNLKEEYKNLFFEIISKKDISLHEKSLANYLLSKIHKTKDEYEKEVEFLKKSHEDIFNSKKIYNLQSNFYFKEVISKKFNEIVFTNIKKNEKNIQKISPIFIIGLPRSGSTLVETRLAYNSKIKSVGESSIINLAILNQISHNIFVKNLNIKDYKLSMDYSQLESFVLKRFSNLIDLNENLRFVDKTLENFFNIDIILKLFPNAKFLHCFRNLNDAVIAIFQSLLPTLSWTHNLDDITSYIDDYLKTINYFKKKYPDKIMNIKLEELTEDNEKLLKEVYKFCNLDWNERSSNINKNKNLQIKTTSNVQSRDRIKNYNYSQYQQYKFILKEYKKKYKWL